MSPIAPAPLNPKNEGMSVTSFFATVRSWGFERRSDAPIAGVASGLADAWRVDPILVRAGFLALTFVGGAGPMLYALCWAVLPDARTQEIHLEEAINGRFPIGLVGAMSLFLVTLATFTSMSFFSALGLLITAIIALLVYTSMSVKDPSRQPPAAPIWDEATQSWTAPTSTTTTASAPSDTPRTSPDTHDATSSTFASSAPSSVNNFGSDPMYAHANPAAAPRTAEQRTHADFQAGRAQAAREHAQAAQAARAQRVEERNRRHLSGRLLAGLLGFALLALAAFIVVVDSGYSFFSDVSPVAASIGFFAALLGLIVMVVGVFGRRGGFLSFLAVVVALIAVPPVVTNTTVYSNSTFTSSRVWAPRSSADIGTGYSVHMGDATLNFTSFVPDNPPETINVVSSMSSLDLLFAADQKVAIISRVTMGSLESDSPGVRLAGGEPLDDIEVAGISRDTVFIGGITSVSDADIVIEADISMSGAQIQIVR